MKIGNCRPGARITISLLALIILFNLIKLWSFKYFPSADGAAHLEIASITRHLLENDCANINQAFQFTPAVTPTWIANFILVPLLKYFPSYIAEKILVSLYLLFFPLAIYTFIRRINPSSVAMSIPCCLFITNYTYYSGNYNFLLSFILYLLSLKWFVTRRDCLIPAHPKLRRYWRIISLIAIFLANYTFHLFGFLAFCFTIFVTYSYDLLKTRNWLSYWRNGLYVFFCALPSLLFFLQYLALPRVPLTGESNLSLNLLHIIAPSVIYNGFDFSFIAMSLANIYFLGMIIWLKARQEEDNKYNFFFWLALSFVALTLILPGGFAGGSGLGPRLQLYIYIFLFLWLASFEIKKNLLAIVVAISMPLLVFQSLASLNYYLNYNKLMANFEYAEKLIPGHSIFYFANLSPENPPGGRIAYFKTGGYLSADTSCLVNTGSYALAEKNTFPVEFKDRYNPALHLGRFRDEIGRMLRIPEADFAKYYAETGVGVDFIIIMGDKTKQFTSKDSFRKFYQSEDGNLKIYKYR